MCTVTYIPTTKGFVFTSNRDEQPKRVTLSPAYYKESKMGLFYPKDKVAGGTWIGVAEQKRLVCLLNGGFVYHDPKVKFANSRGVVVTTILTSLDLKSALYGVDLENVAPFTLIVVDWANANKAYELVWCKNVRHVTELDVKKPYIWSSSTLYTDEVKAERKEWFAKEVLSEADNKKSTVLSFHKNELLGTVETSPKMKREIVETISTTMVIKEDNEISMEYHDYVGEGLQVFKNIFSEVNV